MLFYLAQPAALLGIALALVVGIYVGSAAQVLAAQALGDPLGRRSGRLAPAPPKHVSPFSVVTMVIVGTGWGEPVPMNERWRKRRFHVVAAVLARPLAYALLCLAAVAGLRGVTRTVVVDEGDRTFEVTAASGFTAELLFAMAFTFAALCVTALIPSPPTDGGRVLFALGGTSHGWQNARYQLEERNWGLVIVMGLLLLPVLILGFPSWVGQLAPPLVSGLGALVGLDLL